MTDEHMAEALIDHPLGPQKLSELREIAANDQNGSDLFVVIEECADYFAPPTGEDELAVYDEAVAYIKTVVNHLDRLAPRRAVSVGSGGS